MFLTILLLVIGCDTEDTIIELTDLNVSGATLNASNRYELPGDGSSSAVIKVRAKVYDENAETGKNVTFEIVEDNGKKGSFSPSPTEGMSSITVTTENGGFASATLYAPIIKGNVDIKITFEDGDTGKATMIVPFYFGDRVAGNKLSQFEISCDNRNVMAFYENTYEGNTEIKIRCEIITKNRLGEPVQVPEGGIIFKAEVGKLIYDSPLVDVEGKNTGGYVYYYVLNKDKLNQVSTFKEFLDVPPLTSSKIQNDNGDIINPEGLNEPFYVDGDGNTRNPRDGMITLMIFADGEEYFEDQNLNGVFDTLLGEAFKDQGEPFLDSNDSGHWEDPEYYYDEDQDGKYDGPDGEWNEVEKKISAFTKILLTDAPDDGPDTTTLIYNDGLTDYYYYTGFGGIDLFQNISSLAASIPCTQTYFNFTYRLVDKNFNNIAAQVGSTYTASVEEGGVSLSGTLGVELQDSYGVELDDKGRITKFLMEGNRIFPSSLLADSSHCDQEEAPDPLTAPFTISYSINTKTFQHGPEFTKTVFYQNKYLWEAK